MDLIRLIKIKKLNNELDNLTEQEKLLCSIFNNLYKSSELYYTNKNSGKILLKFNEYNLMVYSLSNLYFLFYDEYNYLAYEYNNFIEKFFKERLNITVKSKIISSLLDNSKIMPTEDPNSNCYGCTAGMCDHQICRGDQYFWNINNVML